jgi:hypothetical protein
VISYDQAQQLIAQADTKVRMPADAAFQKLLAKIRAGQTSRAAIDAVLREFNADLIPGLTEVFRRDATAVSPALLLHGRADDCPGRSQAALQPKGQTGVSGKAAGERSGASRG